MCITISRLNFKIPSPISSTETSCVPPPQSNTSILDSLSFLSSPYASAAVGSLIILSTFNPAISPASIVAVLSASPKYAGTVITALVTSCPK
jgi:hypothetical protein